MNDTLTLIFSGITGFAIGAVFFGGLWWTVRRGMQSPRPALWFLTSMLIRTGITLTGFYFVGAGQWQKFAVCLFGFVIARLLITWKTRPTQEERHAPES